MLLSGLNRGLEAKTAGLLTGQRYAAVLYPLHL
jgi:hypothetical protein